MNTPPRTPPPDENQLSLDFLLKWYSALRTMRIYPSTNPQVQSSNDLVLKAFATLLEYGAGNSITVALSDQKILTCGQQLRDKDQLRPQIQGLIALFNRMRVHSFTFQSTFAQDYRAFLEILSGLLGNKELTQPLPALLESAGIHSVTVASNHNDKVAVPQGGPGAFLPGTGSLLPSPLPATPTPPLPTDEEAEIFVLAAQGERDQAKKRLLDLITTIARAGDFQAAERLRERMYEIDSLALSEIIRSGEIIEQEKRRAIREDDLAIWAELNNRLSPEEFSTMYHAFSERHYTTEETIVSQGDANDTLIFIAQGSIKVSYQLGLRDLFITSLNRGQIAGENFFAPSFWTVSLSALTPVKIYILKQTAIKAWQDKFPGLRAKLYDFYNDCNDIREILAKKRLERRREQRFTLSRKIQVQPITTLDTTSSHGFRAETVDISAGGLAFIIRISNKENARLLLGRRMQTALPVGGAAKYLYFKGVVVSIQPFQLLENDYSVHCKFDHPMEPQELQTILG